MKTIIFSAKAARDLDALPGEARVAIEMGLARYAMTGYGDVKRLQGAAYWRLRIGNYRVVFDEDGATVLAVYVGRRTGNTYSRR